MLNWVTQNTWAAHPSKLYVWETLDRTVSCVLFSVYYRHTLHSLYRQLQTKIHCVGCLFAPNWLIETLRLLHPTPQSHFITYTFTLILTLTLKISTSSSFSAPTPNCSSHFNSHLS